jgi:cell division protein FtsQ
MWDNPRLLNGISAGLLAVAGLLVSWGVYYSVVTSQLFPLRVVRVVAMQDADVALSRVTQEQLDEALAGRVSGNFFGLDLDGVRNTIGALPWVRKVAVRRAWPDRIDVAIEEHVVLARWGTDRLVNVQGEVFEGGITDRERLELPQLSGPAATERQVTARYRTFKSILEPLGANLEPREVLLSGRYAWRLRLANGLVVELGRETGVDTAPTAAGPSGQAPAPLPVADRLSRFAASYPQTLGKLRRRLDYVDLRYPNGFALRVPEIMNPDSDKKAARKRA